MKNDIEEIKNSSNILLNNLTWSRKMFFFFSNITFLEVIW